MVTKKGPLAAERMEAWYQQTVSKLYRFTYALLQNREEAEDITQEPSEEFTGNLHEELLSKFRPRPRKRFLPWTSLAASILATIFLISVV